MPAPAANVAPSETQPGDDADPVDLAFDDGKQDEFKGKQARQREGGAKAPANARDIANEKIGKPCGDHCWADDHEIAERDQIAEKRQMPARLGTIFSNRMAQSDRTR